MRNAGTTISSIDQAVNEDIIRMLNNSVPAAAEQMKFVAPQFRGVDNQQTAFNIWRFLKSMRYSMDKDEHQVIQLPSRLLKTLSGDCKSYSLFTASILENLGIPYVFRYTNYSGMPIPRHVYVVANPGSTPIVIDAVASEFNFEKPFKYKRDMRVSSIAGFDSNSRRTDSRKNEILNFGISASTEDTAGAVGAGAGAAAGTMFLGPGIGTAVGGWLGDKLGRYMVGLGGKGSGSSRIENEKKYWQTWNEIKPIMTTAFGRTFDDVTIRSWVDWIITNKKTVQQWFEEKIKPSAEYLSTQQIRTYYNNLGVPFDSPRMADFVYAEKNGSYTRAFLSQQAKDEFGAAAKSKVQNLPTTGQTPTTGTSSNMLLIGGVGLAALLGFMVLRR